MRQAIISFFFFLLFSTPQTQAQFEGTFGLGAHVGYGSEINSPGAGIHFHFYRTNNIRFAPSFTTFIKRKGDSMWMVDGDLHYILPVSYSASLYPIAGLHYSQWGHEASKDTRINNGNHGKRRLGGNLGLGMQHDIAYRIRANFELKYQFIPGRSQVFLSAGIGFWF